MNGIKYWIKEKIGLIDKNGVDRMNYLLMKVDYLSTELNEAKEKILKLEQDMSSIYNVQSDMKTDISMNEDEIDTIKGSLEEHSLPYLWEIVDENKDFIKNLEVLDEHHVRDIINQELEALQSTEGIEATEEDIVSNERLITGIVRSEIAEYNEFIINALSDKSFD
jgi:chromosome segregation ATPase